MNGAFSLFVALWVAEAAVAGQAPPKLITSESGTSGVERGAELVIDDPRNTFHYPEDRQIIVRFEWEGRPGRHHFEGRWKNPSGDVVVRSELEYESPGSRFSAYWTLQLSDAVVPGLWALEAIVDGAPAGLHAFELRSAESDLERARGADLAPGDLYARLQAATLEVTRVDAGGRTLATGSGVLVPGSRLLTTFDIIDGAARLRATLSDGRTAELERVIAWDRRANWALFEFPLEAASLELASEPGAIGDRCVSLDVPFGGGRVLADGRIVGIQSFPEVGERLTVSFPLHPPAFGSPLVNGRAELLGLVVAPGTWPGVASLRALRLTRPFVPDGSPMESSSVGLVTPLARIDVDSQDGPVALSDLRERGQFLAPLVESPHIGRALLLRELDTEAVSGGRLPFEGEFEFSRTVGVLVAFVFWNPLADLETEYWLEVYDLDNRPLLRGEALPLKMEAYTRSHTAWTLGIGNLPPATYRVDLVLAGQAVWRSFFKVVE